MRQTIWALAFLAAGTCLEAKQIAVYGRNTEAATVLAEALKTGGNTVRRLDEAAFCRSEELLAADLLVIAEPCNVPADSAGALKTFLSARKGLLLLGPRPFAQPLFETEGEWLTHTERMKRRAQLPCRPLKLPGTDAWHRSAREKDVRSSFAVEDGGCLHYGVEVLVGWTTYAAPCPSLFPKGDDLLCLSVKGNAGERAVIYRQLRDIGVF